MPVPSPLSLSATFPPAPEPSAHTQGFSTCCSPPSPSVGCHRFHAGVASRLSPPVPHLWPCPHQHFEPLHWTHTHTPLPNEGERTH